MFDEKPPILCQDRSEEYTKIVIKENINTIKDIRSGKPAIVGFILGKVMIMSGGSVNPGLVLDAIEKEIKNINLD